MKKKILYCLRLGLIFCLYFFVNSVQTSFCEDMEHHCTTVIAGKNATADGSVLFGHNEDDDGITVNRTNLVPRIYHKPGEKIEMWDITLPSGIKGTIDQVVGETWAYSATEQIGPAGRFAGWYINEWGVAIASNGTPSIEKKPYDLTNGGINQLLKVLVVERAKTAREGVQIIGEIIEKHGFAHAGRTYPIADPKEAWIVSAVAGRHWVAQRVPNDQVVFFPNQYTIQQVNLSDTKNFLGSPDLIKYAIGKGWYDPAGGEPFNFAKVYGGYTHMDIRLWGGQRLLTGIKQDMSKMAPFSVKPTHKLSVKNIMDVLRCHYEGTDSDTTINGDPHHTSTYTICNVATQDSFVMQLRSNMPSPIGNVYWKTHGRPCESVYVPWYLGMLKIAMPYTTGAQAAYDMNPLDARYYDPHSAYWVFNRLAALVDLDYLVKKPMVRHVWDDIEATEFALQDEIEKTALKIYQRKNYDGKDGRYLANWFLTKYSQSLALDAYYKALEFIDKFTP